MRFLSLAIAAFSLFASLAFAQDMDAMKGNVTQTEQGGNFVNVTQTLNEHIMGDPAAPVTVIEYASLTCTHCAHFTKDILPSIVEKYVSTGKIKIIYRDFPLNALALKAAQLAQCMPEERYFPFVKTLFENLESWSGTPDPEATLQQYAKLAGLPGERVTACLNDKNLQNALVKRRMEAEKQFNITGTPSFVIDYGKETITGVQSLDDFDKVIGKYIKADAKK